MISLKVTIMLWDTTRMRKSEVEQAWGICPKSHISKWQRPGLEPKPSWLGGKLDLKHDVVSSSYAMWGSRPGKICLQFVTEDKGATGRGDEEDLVLNQGPETSCAQPCPTLCNPTDCSPPGSSVHGDSPGKNTGVGFHALLQGIYPTPGIEPRPPALQVDSLPSEPPGKPLPAVWPWANDFILLSLSFFICLGLLISH